MAKLRALDIVVPVLLVCILALAGFLRIQEAASSPVIGAEDPYTHLVFTKEALARGYFGDSQWLGTSMYPPGLHALGGILASDSGTPLVDWVRWSPMAFGLLAVLGMFVLANRLGGPAAGLTAALLTAVIPEHVFRTELYFPTALDLAVLPAYLLAFVLATDATASKFERVGGVALFAVLTPALAFTHPWAVPLFLVPAALYLALRVVREGGTFRVALDRLVPGAIMGVVAFAFALASRWDHTESGFATFFDHLGPLALLSRISLPGVLLFPVFLAVLALGAAPAVILGAAVATLRVPHIVRLALGVVCAIAAIAAVRVVAAHPPAGVNYPNMLGLVAIWLALAGVGLAFLRPSPLGQMGFALGAFLLPLTAIDLFASPFWPQRTVAYLAVAVALLGASVASTLVDVIVKLRPLRAPRRASWVAPVAVIAVFLMVAGATQAAPAHVYKWYRLYSDDEYAGIEKSADLLSDPHARIIVYSWQPGVFLKAFANPDQIRYCPKCYQDPTARSAVMAEGHGAVYAVVDRYTDKDAARGKADPSWATSQELVLKSGDWRVYRVGGG